MRPLPVFVWLLLGSVFVALHTRHSSLRSFDAKWVDRAQAGYLGGFNCLVYIIACVAGICLPNLIGIRLLMRISTFLAVIGLTMYGERDFR